MSTNTRLLMAMLGLSTALLLTAGAPSQRDDRGRGASAWTREELEWTPEEREIIRSLWLGSLEPLTPDPSNRYADDPRAADLGERLFFDAGFSVDGSVSCATCHRPELGFQDGLPLARGVGVTNRRTMPVVATAYSPWQFWDGRKDSQWAQALGPLESPVEHGGDRLFHVRRLAEVYSAPYEEIFGPLPDLTHLPPRGGPVEDRELRRAWERLSRDDRDGVNRAFANLGKAIAAYERTLVFGPSRFDAYAAGVLGEADEDATSSLTADEEAGLRLFIGKAGCIDCHNGPRLTDDYFHNTGVPAVKGLPRDRGRQEGAALVRADEFNCLGAYSDASPRECAELRFMVADGRELVRAFKTPSLRGVAQRAPYMHAGQIPDLAAVVAHYDRAPRAPDGHSEIRRLDLTATQRRQLAAFLRALDGPVAVPPAVVPGPSDGGGRRG